MFLLENLYIFLVCMYKNINKYTMHFQLLVTHTTVEILKCTYIDTNKKIKPEGT